MREFAWNNRPSKRSRGRAIFGIVVIILTGTAIFWAADNNWIFGLIAMGLMTFASGRFYFKTDFYADEIGIGERFMGYSRKRKWGEFKRVDIGKTALFLSPFERPRRLENYRGWFVPVPSDEVKRFILDMVRRSDTPEEKRNSDKN